MAFLSKLIQLEDALNLLNQNQKEPEIETIDIKNAHNRVLAQDIISYHNSPPFDKSAMDGYAIIGENSFGASNNNHKTFEIIDDICAGNSTNKTVNENEAVRIATGAPIPEGANSVIMEEYTTHTENKLEIHSQVTPGENISNLGEDFKKGDLILSKNTFIRSQELGLIASAGFNEIKVYKKPNVKLLVTGSELVNPSPVLEDDKIINSNQFTISSLIESSGANVSISHVEDDFEKVKDEISEVSKYYDVIITTGGTAISKGDVVVDVIEDLGEIIFHGVTMRPGRPVGCGIVNNMIVFNLSGQPVAAMTQFDVFVRKYLSKLQGLDYNFKIVQRESQLKIPSKLGRTDFIRGFADDSNVKHVLNRSSGVIRSMVDANGYIIIDEGNEGVQKGEMVNFVFFDSLVWNKY